MTLATRLSAYGSDLRRFFELIIAARRDDGGFDFGRFIANPILVEVADRLLTARLKEGIPGRRQEAMEALQVEIFSKLVLGCWEPLPALSQREFQNQLVEFLRRRIDWERVLSRNGSGMARFRDDLHEVDDSDEDDDDST